MAFPEGAETKYCQTCGEEIHAEAVICPECGVEQPPLDTDLGGASGVIDAYPMWAWLAGLVLTVIAFGWGLVALGYFVIKGSKDDFDGQSDAEILTVLTLAIIGIVIVEVGGEEGTRKFWRGVVWVLGGLVALGLVLVVIILLIAAVA